MYELELYEILSKIDNLETETDIALKDLRLEIQNQFLEFFKNLRTANIIVDCEKQKPRASGFSNHKQSRTRDPKIYTIAESKLKELADSYGLHYVHELRIKVKDYFNRLHTYKLDFYFPASKINVEINPLFHKTYLLVNTRDRLRKKLLKKLGIKSYAIDAYCGKNPLETTIDKNRARKILSLISKTQTSRETLSYYQAS